MNDDGATKITAVGRTRGSEGVGKWRGVGYIGSIYNSFILIYIVYTYRGIGILYIIRRVKF